MKFSPDLFDDPNFSSGISSIFFGHSGTWYGPDLFDDPNFSSGISSNFYSYTNLRLT
jgi:hypothetical protein